MIAITRLSLAKETAKRWKIQYGTDKYDVYKKLVSLGDSPNPDQVDAIIGNGSWTRVPHCSECSSEGEAIVIQVGETPDYDSHTAYLCSDCIRDALSISIR